jgi:hypothetical protein
MERLKQMQETLMYEVEKQMGDLCHCDTEELGQVMDMIKDLSETMYYCSIVKAMEHTGEDYTMDYITPIRMDTHYGVSPMSRKSYLETKETGDKESQMKHLEKYLHELTEDIIEMSKGATPEEKQLIQKKLSSLAIKIDG